MKNKRSLAILGTRGIPARYGGFETFAEELATRLVAEGWKVAVYCEGGDYREDEYRGVRRIFVPIPQWGGASTVIFDLRCLWHARRTFDVVYMLGYGAALFCFIPRLWSREVWINMDGVEWRRSKWSWLPRIWLRAMEGVAMWTPSRIIADAQAIQDELLQRHPRTPPCHVIPYGAEVVVRCGTTFLDTLHLKSGQYCLVVCRLEPENHVLEIVQGYLRATSALPLVVVGDHRMDNCYVRKLRELSGERVRFVGPVYDQGHLIQLRWHARLYLHGHSVGGTNPSLLEAMGCENAIIAHDNHFNREVAGDCAVYFKDEEGVRFLLDALIEDASECERLGKASRDRVAKYYSWKSVVSRYAGLIEI